jgi:type VI secretion system secreted protein VgrG
MAPDPVHNAPVFEFEAGSYGADDLRVLSFHGAEGISELYRFDIVIGSRDHEIDPDAVVGQDARLAWKDKEGDRWVHGIICRFEQSGRAGRFANYQARLVPKVWLLTLRRQCRIFQNKAVPDILKEVLDKAGLPADLYEFRLKGNHKAREYCVQYRESDWNFASRLMEEEGIFYFFEHTEDSHKLIMADVSSVHEPTPGKSQIPFRDPELGVGEQEQVSRFRYSVQIRHGAVTLRDFDFKKPSLKVENAKAADVETDLEWYDYPGEYTELSTGKDLAEVRLQEFRSERALGVGEGNCTHLISGYKFTLEDHPWAEMNQEWVLLRVQHWCSQPQAAEEQAGSAEQAVYQNSFECVPYAVPYRPRRWTPRPRIEGPQTAIVVGPAGEEIHTDEYGRVKVQFHWDRNGKKDDKSSCWIRVSQGWGGAGYGMIIIPRIGHEVVVDFLEGDPDQPLIVGRVYNGESPPPYGLPGAKTKSSFKSNTSPGGGGSNELRFEDAGGSEEIYLHGQKDWNTVIEHDKTESIGNNNSESIGNDETIDVKNNRSKTVGVDQSETIGSNKTISVGVNHDEKIGADMSLNVGSNKSETVAIASSETVGAAKTLTIGAAYQVSVGGAMNETVGATKAVEVGGSSSETIGASRTEKVGGEKSETVGASKNVKITGDLSDDVGGNRAVKVGKNQAVDVVGNMTGKAGKNVILDAGKNCAVTAGDQIVLECGSASITLKKNGDITIKGKKISVKADSDIVMKGQNIKQN